MSVVFPFFRINSQHMFVENLKSISRRLRLKMQILVELIKIDLAVFIIFKV